MLPRLEGAGDAGRAMAAITVAVADAQITPSEAAELSKIVDAFVRAIEASEFDQRLRVIEARGDATRP
jgi:hypothetical protein